MIIFTIFLTLSAVQTSRTQDHQHHQDQGDQKATEMMIRRTVAISKIQVIVSPLLLWWRFFWFKTEILSWKPVIRSKVNMSFNWERALWSRPWFVDRIYQKESGGSDQYGDSLNSQIFHFFYHFFTIFDATIINVHPIRKWNQIPTLLFSGRGSTYLKVKFCHLTTCMM